MDWLDRTGIVASSACALHCAATGALLAVPALLAWGSTWVPWLVAADPWLLGSSLICAVIALAHGAWRHGRKGPLALGLLGGLGWGASTLVVPSHGTLAAVLSVLAGASLVAAHGWNLRCARSCRHAMSVA